MVWTGTPGSGDLTMAGEFTVASTHNILIGSGADIASGENVLALANALTDPVSLAALEGGNLYVHSGDLRYIGPAGEFVLVPVNSGHLATHEFQVASSHNIRIGSGADPASGQNMVAIANALTDPSSLAGLVGGVLFVHSGSLIYMGPTGTVTSLAAL